MLYFLAIGASFSTVGPGHRLGGVVPALVLRRAEVRAVEDLLQARGSGRPSCRRRRSSAGASRASPPGSRRPARLVVDRIGGLDQTAFHDDAAVLDASPSHVGSTGVLCTRRGSTRFMVMQPSTGQTSEQRLQPTQLSARISTRVRPSPRRARRSPGARRRCRRRSRGRSRCTCRGRSSAMIL